MVAFFGIVAAVMVFAVLAAANGWVALYDVLVDAGGFYQQAGRFLGWLVWVLRIDYLLSVVVFVHSFGLLMKLWWPSSGSWRR